MPQCIICKAETKFEGGLCYPCYKKDKSKEKEVVLPEASGLSHQERNYRYNMIKGRIAETLIQELFLSLGFNVFRYGMENTIPGIMELLKGVKSDVASEIRRMPDFVIQNPNNNSVHFIEVKFRTNGCFTLADLYKNYPYQNALIILVSKKHIKCISVEELNTGKEINETSRNYLGSRKEFELNKDVIIEFCAFATKFFEGV
ncbi:hypothetical protein [Leeuwenhoekiella marinoflava]|uniref:Uncharacterized protein n=2 Tax=Leeuwenhoekiella marinoflava TaxID=988 RepID=A0A4Q0PNE0_9FLAO|nr:hypothetical protein [Leeuwenhoekiella marinoflava]RXG29887.1 hypothetical protein DSL99_1940 [Leeuwenhoekiella marinoflava]SHF27271.1 hypothetical protein SAMN02745246_02097 [Leeuwenhoekiella marinoflava DSM 3653]